MSSPRSSILASEGLALLSALTGAALLLDLPLGRDQGVFMTVAQVMSQGGVPYLDAWDVKPPGIFLVFWLSSLLPLGAELSPRILQALALLSLFLPMRALSQRVTQSTLPGAWAVALTVLAELQLDFWHSGQPEMYGGVLLVWVCYLSWCQPGLAASLLAGILCGLAALMKPPLGAGILLLGCASLAQGEKRQLAGGLLGFLGSLFVSIGGLWLLGAGTGMREIFTDFLPRYAELRPESMGLVQATLLASWRSLSALSLWLPLGLLSMGLYRDSSSRSILLSLWGMAALQCLGIGMQGKMYAYHFAALPVLLFLPGLLTFHRLSRQLQLGSLSQAGAALVLSFAVSASPGDLRGGSLERNMQRVQSWLEPERRESLRSQLYSIEDHQWAELQGMAEEIQLRSEEGDRMWIWGFQTVLHVLSGVPPANRYLYNVPQRVPWGEPARVQLLEALEESPPRWVVIARGDGMPWMTGNWLDSAQALQEQPALEAWVRGRYEPRLQSEHLFLLERAP